MKAILTKWLSATDTKPTRIKAYDADGNSITMSYNQSREDDDSVIHAEVVQALIDKLDWDCEILGDGYIKGGRCYVLTMKKHKPTKKHIKKEWVLIDEIKGRKYWKRSTGLVRTPFIYQCLPFKPTSDGGYYSIDDLKKLKGDL